MLALISIFILSSLSLLNSLSLAYCVFFIFSPFQNFSGEGYQDTSGIRFTLPSLESFSWYFVFVVENRNSDFFSFQFFLHILTNLPFLKKSNSEDNIYFKETTNPAAVTTPRFLPPYMPGLTDWLTVCPTDWLADSLIVLLSHPVFLTLITPSNSAVVVGGSSTLHLTVGVVKWTEPRHKQTQHYDTIAFIGQKLS